MCVPPAIGSKVAGRQSRMSQLLSGDSVAHSAARSPATQVRSPSPPIVTWGLASFPQGSADEQFPAANNSLTAILWKCARGGACGPVRAASAYWIGLASGSPPMQKVAPRQLSHGSLVSTLLVAALCGTFSLAAMAAPEVWLEDL